MASIRTCIDKRFIPGLDGAAAGIRTRVTSMRLSNIEAWEAPVIDQAVLTAQPWL